MRKYLLYIILFAHACTYTYAQSFCHLVQDIASHYEDTIEAAGTYYYSANTDSLPMDLYFISTDPTCATPPELWFDLTCTPGVYSDPNIRELLQDTAKYGISVPMKLNSETEWVDSIQAFVHHLKLGKSYRNRLKLVGINYNVRAYVKVVVPCAGIAKIEQDTSSMACYNEARRVNLPDSTHVLANDSLNTYIFPYKDWIAQADSVALHWEGTDSVILWIESSDCEFIPDALHAWDFYDIPANGEYHLSRKQMEEALRAAQQDTTGFFFAKIFSAEEGRLFTRPLIPETKGATMLQFDSTYQVSAGENSFFCFPISWESIKWEAQTRKKVTLYLHASPDQAPVDSFSFDLENDSRRVLFWSKPEMALIKPRAVGQLLFVRFRSSADFRLTPLSLSDLSPCVNKATRLRSGVTYPCSKDKIFGLYYSDWEGYPMQIQWVAPDPNDLQNFFIADTCEFQLRWNVYSTRKRCVYYYQTPRGSQTFTIDSTTIAEWKSRVKADGYFYLRITAGGTITFTNNKPEEEEPEDTPTGWFYVEPETEYRKVIHNGQIYILRDGKTYTITGQSVKIE
ncbi:MAG: hypothetical protein IKP57_03750 [Paludibacteraceae bacterium]|nr:hypothetical protein [Paludibacteraceae bacterium]